MDDGSGAFDDGPQSLAGLKSHVADGQGGFGLVVGDPRFYGGIPVVKDGVRDLGDGIEGSLNGGRVTFVEGEGNGVAIGFGASLEGICLGNGKSGDCGGKLEGHEARGEEGGEMHCLLNWMGERFELFGQVDEGRKSDILKGCRRDVVDDGTLNLAASFGLLYTFLAALGLLPSSSSTPSLSHPDRHRHLVKLPLRPSRLIFTILLGDRSETHQSGLKSLLYLKAQC